MANGSEATQIFRQTNDPIAKIDENEGGLYVEVCPDVGYSRRYGGRKFGGPGQICT
jgi:hypothetical protein